MQINNILDSIKNNNISSNYLLFGEEDFFIDQIASCFHTHTISESEKIFNEKIFYGKEVSVFSLLSELKSFPMMGNRQLIILREAQKLDKIDELSNYLLEPIDSTIFIVCYKGKKVDKRKKWVKLFQKVGVVFESKLLYGEKISNWIRYNLSEKHIRIEKSAELLLVDYLGNNLSKITNAINKLSSIISDSLITDADVQEHIGVHRDYNTFELQNALGEKNNIKVLSIIDYFTQNPKKFPLPPIIGLLFLFFSKILIIHSLDIKSEKIIADKIKVHPFFVKVYISAAKNYSFEDCIKVVNLLKDADLKFKGIQGSANHTFLKELILRIIY
ncbi:MAG: DNA polymerase III subunit delta [Flavobacteriales bacterium]|nr:DNA polymerase III subunit delta [Flavobacteriales bacterium]